MTEEINHPRRRLLGAAALAVAAARFGTTASAQAQSDGRAGSRIPAVTPGTNTSFGSLRQIDAGVLNVGYAEAGPRDGPRSSFCMAGPTTSIAMSTSRRSWRRPATA